MDCVYFLKGKDTPYTYKELVEMLQRNANISSISDIVFSMDDVEIVQDSIYNKLSGLRAEGFAKPTTQIINGKKTLVHMSYSDGEPIISDNESISCQEFIDTPTFSSEAKSYTRMSDDDYITSIVAALTTGENPKSQEEAEYIARLEVEHWKTIGEDAASLHSLIADFDFRKGKSDFQQLLSGTKFEGVSGALYDSLTAFRKNAFGTLKDRCRGIPSKVVYNINLKAQIEGLDKTLFGHIDMIAIDGDGDLHLFNYKVTTTSIQPKSVKLEKYKYQMALLRLILASHGFKVRNATLNIVPIKVGYNEDYSLITSAVANKNPTELTVEGGRYIFTRYDTVARKFIKATVNTDSVSSVDLDEVSKILKLVFPERDIASDGIRMTAQEWIKKNRAAILDSNDPDYAYEIEFGEGDVVKIPKEFHARPEYNSAIIEAINLRQELLDTNSDVPINRLVKAIRGGFKSGGYSFLNDKAYYKNGAYLNTIFNKYFPQSETPSDWGFIENDILNGAGIMLFKHKENDQLDVVAFSPYDLQTFVKFNKGGDSILGCLFPTATSLNLAGISDIHKYRATYGNIEAVKAMVLLNLILPKIEGDFTLGKLHVLSLQGNGQGIPFSMESLNKECFSNILKVVNKFPETSVKNNFTKYKFVDRFGTLLLEYDAVIKDSKITTESDKQELIETGFGRLSTADTIEARLNALRLIESAMLETFPGLKLGRVKNAVKNVDRKVGLLYQRVVDAITYYSVGEISPVEKKISSLDKNVFVSSRVPNRNVRIVTDLYTKTINTIAERAENKYIPIRKLLFQFYDDIGYSRFLNSTIGGLARQFNDLYRKDANGNRLLRLLNPYDENDMALIRSHRGVKLQFLKKILFEFAKIRYPMNNIKFNFTSESDPNLQAFIEQHRDTYFNIPLEKASVSTRRLNYSLKLKLSYIKNKAMELLRNPKLGIEEFVNKVASPEELALRDEGIEAMQLSNKFSIGESNERENYIARHGADYFETNLETLIADFIERDIETQEYNKALVTIKGILFLLDLLGDESNLKGVVDLTKEMINNFVKVNIFNASIMNATSLKILGITAPLRRLVSDTLIGGNVIAGVRDTFEGVWLNTLRSLNHYQTDIDKKSLAKAYATVVKNSFTDGRSINIVNQLCQIYRLSNVDVARISEGLKSERGASNFKDWMYSTLRRPDFLNRMTLFVAKCYKDGVYDAFDIKDGQLVYDWRKDKRFEGFAKGKDHPKYAEHMGAYYNAVRAYNQDHPDATIGYDEDLPMPYSFQEVEAMKNVANSIYGSYDRSTRAAYEHMALGTFFGMFSTWMNGIYTNYMMKPGLYQNGEFQLVLATDESGNLKFFDDLGLTLIQITDGEGNVKYFYEGTMLEATENLTKLQPVMDKVPIVIQGIWYTITDTLKTLTGKGGNFKEDIWLDPVLRKNLDKLFTDLLAWFIFAMLYKFALTPGYKEFKKGMKERDVVTNGVVELLYKSSSRSYDGFRGVYNVFEYLGENTNPPVYTLNLKLLKETGSVLMGNRSMSDALNGNVAVFKTFQDTWRAYNKSQQQQ